MSARHQKRESGMSMLELLVVMAVIGILATILIPRFICMMRKASVAEKVDYLRLARDRVELFEVEFSQYPASLADVFAPADPPEDIIYCRDGDASPVCAFLGDIDVDGYAVRTFSGIDPGCQEIDYYYATCCGQEPQLVAWDPGGSGLVNY